MNTELGLKSNNFLSNVQQIVGIVDKFDRDLICKKIKLDNHQRELIHHLCESDNMYRKQFNKRAFTLRANENWSYDVINKYFD
jgi:hypothetical protein